MTTASLTLVFSPMRYQFKRTYPRDNVHASVYALIDAAKCAHTSKTSVEAEYALQKMLPPLLWKHGDVRQNQRAATVCERA